MASAAAFREALWGDIFIPFSAEESAAIRERLNRKVSTEHIASRIGPNGKKIYYLPAERSIKIANEIFGFDGWNSTVRDLRVDFCDEKANKKWSVGLSATVRVTLKNGAHREDIGYGSVEDGASKVMVMEKAKKIAAADGLKRALRCFGDALGNCLYDNDYLAYVARSVVADPDPM
ncbi:DNA repair protein rad52 [Rhizina undulata]